MSRTNSHGPKDVRVIEVWLYMNLDPSETCALFYATMNDKDSGQSVLCMVVNMIFVLFKLESVWFPKLDHLLTISKNQPFTF